MIDTASFKILSPNNKEYSILLAFISLNIASTATFIK